MCQIFIYHCGDRQSQETWALTAAIFQLCLVPRWQGGDALSYLPPFASRRTDFPPQACWACAFLSSFFLSWTLIGYGESPSRVPGLPGSSSLYHSRISPCHRRGLTHSPRASPSPEIIQQRNSILEQSVTKHCTDEHTFLCMEIVHCVQEPIGNSF